MPTIEQTTNHLVYSVAPSVLCVGLGYLVGKKFKPVRSRSQTHHAAPMIEIINHLSYSILHAIFAGGTGYLVGNLFKCIHLSSSVGSDQVRELIKRALAFEQINPRSNFIYCAATCLILPSFFDPHSNLASLVLGTAAYIFVPYQVCQRVGHPLTFSGSIVLSVLTACIFCSVRHIEEILNAPLEQEKNPKSSRKMQDQMEDGIKAIDERLATLVRTIECFPSTLKQMMRNDSEINLSARNHQDSQQLHHLTDEISFVEKLVDSLSTDSESAVPSPSNSRSNLKSSSSSLDTSTPTIQREVNTDASLP
jgi:hypothetical protein